jgi:hypothetical protein
MANELLVTLKGENGISYLATASEGDPWDSITRAAERFYSANGLRVLVNETINIRKPEAR